MLRARLLAIVVVVCAVAVVPTAADAATFGSRVLKRGAHGHDVRVLQRLLTTVGLKTTVDGQFGRGTYRSVRSWEASAARPVDGTVSRPDARALRAAAAAAAPAAAPRSTTAAPGTLDSASTGGTPVGTPPPPVEKATLNPDGTATAPASAPQVVKDIIAAGNEIAFKPYKYGGGHGKWQDSGYDCSGSVSYALHGGGILDSPLDSTSFESWGDPGPGTWVTIYANSGHAYMVVAGLRFDTSAAKAQSNGSRWTDQMRSGDGYVVRHPAGL